MHVSQYAPSLLAPVCQSPAWQFGRLGDKDESPLRNNVIRFTDPSKGFVNLSFCACPSLSPIETKNGYQLATTELGRNFDEHTHQQNSWKRTTRLPEL